MINDMLDVGRLDQGLFHLSRQPVDLVALAQETTGAMQSGKLSIVLRAPDELPAQADPRRIRQALENLVSNALKYSPAGAPIEVTIQEEKRQEGDVERVWAVISVHDQGPGIPAEMRPSLFTRFASGPNSTGLGLGLYLARSIAEAHGGTLTVDSSPGQGTTFYLALPVSA
jgi:signal transduction histidine kinase